MCPGSGHYLHCIIQVYFKACLKLLRQNKNKISITDYEHNLVMGPFFYYKQKENSFHIQYPSVIFVRQHFQGILHSL